ncbi:PPE family protein [Mycolicibacter minnesotensis]
MPADFGMLPPEIISAWMYSGAGSGPLTAAAAAWSSLAAELEAAELAAQLVISELSGEQWTGPASVAMATAVAPYLAWLQSTSVAAQQAGTQAMASAAAFEAARAGTVPPPVIAANRAQLAALVASNILGQNTPAILATEAHYMAMWAQDSLAMSGYSVSSANAATLAPMTPAPQPTSPAGSAAAAGGLQEGLGQTLSTLQGALQAVASPLAAASSGDVLLTDVVDLFLGTPLFANAINGGVNTAAWFVTTTIPTAISLGHTLALAGPGALVSDTSMDAEAIASGLSPMVLASAMQPVGAVTAGAAPMLANLGQASTVGAMSVPGTWPAAASTEVAASAGSGWAVAAEEAAPLHAVPAGMPMGGAGRSGLSSGMPRYGVRPTVMPKQMFV